jgi:polyhydroxyalkanoate synthesis regulator phasin
MRGDERGHKEEMKVSNKKHASQGNEPVAKHQTSSSKMDAALRDVDGLKQSSSLHQDKGGREAPNMEKHTPVIKPPVAARHNSEINPEDIKGSLVNALAKRGYESGTGQTAESKIEKHLNHAIDNISSKLDAVRAGKAERSALLDAYKKESSKLVDVLDKAVTLTSEEKKSFTSDLSSALVQSGAGTQHKHREVEQKKERHAPAVLPSKSSSSRPSILPEYKPFEAPSKPSATPVVNKGGHHAGHDL